MSGMQEDEEVKFKSGDVPDPPLPDPENPKHLSQVVGLVYMGPLFGPNHALIGRGGQPPLVGAEMGAEGQKSVTPPLPIRQVDTYRKTSLGFGHLGKKRNNQVQA